MMDAVDVSPLARYRPLIDDWDAFEAALRRPLPTCVWANPLRTTPERLVDRLQAGGLPVTPLDWSPGAFKLPADFKPGNRFEYLAGLYHIQEEVSMLPVRLLDPQPGERVLDMCAAPGNKTVQIAVQMNNRGTVIANDRSYHRMRAVRRHLDRLGLVNVSVSTYDAANYPHEAGQFDRVLADVPCSCEGTSRKNPEALHNNHSDGLQRLRGTQTAILRKAVQRCKSGGRIVYSTCTYAPEENEAVVHDILTEFPDELHVVRATIPGFRAAEGLTRWQDQAFDERLRMAMRVYPHHNDTGGFFVAVLEKLASTPRAQDAP